MVTTPVHYTHINKFTYINDLDLYNLACDVPMFLLVYDISSVQVTSL